MARKILPYEKTRLEKLLESVCNAFDLERSQVLSKSRNDELVIARFTIYFIANQKFKIGVKVITRFFEYSAHNTIINGLKEARKLLNSDKDYAKAVEEISEGLSDIPVRRPTRQLKVNLD